jgi:hypothetical protein
MKKSGSRIPRIELEEIGPSVDFRLRRTKISSDDLFKLACKRPKELKVIIFQMYGAHCHFTSTQKLDGVCSSKTF